MLCPVNARSAELMRITLSEEAVLQGPSTDSGDVFEPITAPMVHPPGRGEPPRSFDGLRVLLAEDNPVNQRVAVGFLEWCGCEVVEPLPPASR